MPLSADALGAAGGLANVLHWLTMVEEGSEIGWLVTSMPQVAVRLERDGSSGLVGYEVHTGDTIGAAGFTDVASLVAALERALLDLISMCRAAAISPV